MDLNAFTIYILDAHAFMIYVHDHKLKIKLLKSKFDQFECCPVHSPLLFRKIVEIERFALRAAILHDCQNYLGSYNPRRRLPDARPLGFPVRKMKVREATIYCKTRYISTISRKNRGLWTV